MKYTYAGDMNLDGKINVDDYGRIDFNVPLHNSGWVNGDLNYDGKINVDDYGIIDFNIGIQGPPLGSAPVSAAPASTAPADSASTNAAPPVPPPAPAPAVVWFSPPNTTSVAPDHQDDVIDLLLTS